MQQGKRFYSSVVIPYGCECKYDRLLVSSLCVFEATVFDKEDDQIS